jgi:hypothetical protein
MTDIKAMPKPKDVMPFVLFLAGSCLFSLGLGVCYGSSISLISFGTCLAFSWRLLSDKPQGVKGVAFADRSLQADLLSTESYSVEVFLLRDLPPCPLCGSYSALHRTFADRFFILCSNSGCRASWKLQYSHRFPDDAAAYWVENYIPSVQRSKEFGAESQSTTKEMKNA